MSYSDHQCPWSDPSQRPCKPHPSPCCPPPPRCQLVCKSHPMWPQPHPYPAPPPHPYPAPQWPCKVRAGGRPRLEQQQQEEEEDEVGCGSLWKRWGHGSRGGSSKGPQCCQTQQCCQRPVKQCCFGGSNGGMGGGNSGYK